MEGFLGDSQLAKRRKHQCQTRKLRISTATNRVRGILTMRASFSFRAFRSIAFLSANSDRSWTWPEATAAKWTRLDPKAAAVGWKSISSWVVARAGSADADRSIFLRRVSTTDLIAASRLNLVIMAKNRWLASVAVDEVNRIPRVENISTRAIEELRTYLDLVVLD